MSGGQVSTSDHPGWAIALSCLGWGCRGRLWVDRGRVWKGQSFFLQAFFNLALPVLSAGLLEKKAWKVGSLWPVLGLQEDPQKYVGTQGDLLIPILGPPMLLVYAHVWFCCQECVCVGVGGWRCVTNSRGQATVAKSPSFGVSPTKY